MDFAAGEKRSWLRGAGRGAFPVVGWAERGGYGAGGHGNSVPRFHITWGTGPGIVEPFVRRVRAASARGLVELRFRHRVTELVVDGGAVDGRGGEVLEPTTVAPRRPARADGGRRLRDLRAQAVVVTSGGIGGNHDLVPAELAGAARARRPRSCCPGCRRTSTGGCSAVTEARRRPGDQPGPDVALHRGHRQLDSRSGRARHPHPARAVVAVAGRDRPAAAGAAVPRFRHAGHAAAHHAAPATSTPGSCSTRSIIEKEFALSGSEQNPDLTGAACAELLLPPGPAARHPGAGAGVPGPRRRLRRRARPATSWSRG